MTETKNYKLTPSDLTFLYSGCKHCFALKVKHGIRQPSIPIPGIFSTISSLQKDLYSDKRTEEFCNEIPPVLSPAFRLRWARVRQSVSFN